VVTLLELDDPDFAESNSFLKNPFFFFSPLGVLKPPSPPAELDDKDGSYGTQ